MVKFGKKFFFNEEEEKKETPKRREKKKTVKKRDNKIILERIKYYSRRLLPFLLVLVLIIGLLFLIKSCSKNSSKKKNSSDTKETKTIAPKIVKIINIKINEEVPSIERFVRNYDKVKTEHDSITYDQNNFVNNTYNAVGEYQVVIKINNKHYDAKIIVKDDEAPTFNLKNISINEGSSYSVNSFVENCTDNSGKECVIEFTDSAYGKYTTPGVYEVKIEAKDLNGNKAEAKTATITIVANPKPTPTPTPTPPKPVNKTCEYGKNEINSNEIVTYYVTQDSCAVDIEYAKTSTYIAVPNNMAKKEQTQLENDLRNANVQVLVKFDYTITPVLNKAKTGLVGYKVTMSAYDYTNEDNPKLLVKYIIKSNGSRSYQVNTLNLK